MLAPVLACLSASRNSNYGFDPLGLCKNPEGLKRFTESEVIHCRWAMLGAAGCLGVEVLGQGNWYDAPLWVSRVVPEERQLECIGSCQLSQPVGSWQPQEARGVVSASRQQAGRVGGISSPAAQRSQQHSARSSFSRCSLAWLPFG
jgi:hypothetical protein